MLKYLVLIIIVVPLIEIWGLIAAGQWIGWLPTLILCFLSGIVGAWFARTQGLKVLVQAKQRLEMGSMPGDSLLDGICILVGGVFLLSPGFFSDLFGFFLLLPWTRTIVKGMMKNWLRKKMNNGTLYFSNYNRFNRW